MTRRVLLLSTVVLAAIGVVFLFSPDSSFAGRQAGSDQITDAGGPGSFSHDYILVKYDEHVDDRVRVMAQDAVGGEVIETTRLGYDKVSVPDGVEVEDFVESYAKQDGVEVAQPDYVAQIQYTPNDPNFSYQWSFDASHLNMPAAWDQDTSNPKYGGDPSIVVAVVDTGVAYEDRGSFKKAPDFANTNFTAGYDFVNNDSNANDDHGHGTHVAMTIAESTGNNSDQAGIAFNTTIMPVKVMSAYGFGYMSDISDGIDFAVANGADVINLSLGAYSGDSSLETAISSAASAGVVVVASNGNGNAPVSVGGDGVDGTSDPVVAYPARYPGAIGVAATNFDNRLSYYSNYGSGTDIAAPGGDTTADRNGDGYADGILQQTFSGSGYGTFYDVFWEGTSMAAPHVSGVAALLRASGVSGGDVETRIKATAKSNFSGYNSNKYGGGVLDAAAAFSPSSDVSAPSPVKDLAVSSGNKQATITWENPNDSDFAGVKIYRKLNSASQSIGDGTLVYSDSDQKYTDTGLDNNKTYYYSVFTHDAKPNYSAPLIKSAYPTGSSSDTTAPDFPIDFVASADGSDIDLTWTNPSAGDYTGTIVRRNTIGFPSSSSDGTEVYHGTGTSVTDPGLSGTTFYYSAFAYDTSGNVSDPIYSVETPGSTDTTAPNGVSGLSASATLGEVDLTWSDPIVSDYAYTLVRRLPTSLMEPDKTVHTGLWEQYSDDDSEELISGHSYRYDLYVYDTSGNASSSESVSVSIPGASILTAPGSGGGPHVRGFDTDGTADFGTNFFAYDSAFRGGVRLAAGDVDGDGVDEIVTGPGRGGGPHVRIFERDGTPKSIQFFAFHPSFHGGIDVAAGDVDGDGDAEIAVCQFSDGQAWVKVYKYGASQEIVGTWNAFGSPEVGCTVTMGDIDWDGLDEVIVGAGEGGGPHIRVFEANGTPKPIQFFAFHPNSRSGIDVAAGDVDGDGDDEIVAAQLRGQQAWTKVYQYNNQHEIEGEWNAFGSPEIGASVEAVDADADGQAEVVVGAGPGGGPQARIFEANGTWLGSQFFAYDSAFRGGVNVATGSF